MNSRQEFVDALDACERTSAMLLLATETGGQDPEALMALRERQIEALSETLPPDLTDEDIKRLNALLKIGDSIRFQLDAAKASASRNLAALCGELHLAREMAPAAACGSALDCKG
jgi:hypothetical protein